MVGFLLQWPTLPTLVMFPILVAVYRRLATVEERSVRAEFPDSWTAYAAKTPRFLPFRRPGSPVAPTPPPYRDAGKPSPCRDACRGFTVTGTTEATGRAPHPEDSRRPPRPMTIGAVALVGFMVLRAR